MCPTWEQAEELLLDALKCNPGPWGSHSRTAARCAENIARAAGMDAGKAYVPGLMHDIGRKFGARHMGHISDGFRYMMQLGYDEAAKICLTHSFNNQRMDEYIGKQDVSEAELELIRSGLESAEYDDYDRLIQLCDALAGAEGVLDMEERMNDVERRYGGYPEPKRETNRRLRSYFEEKTGRDIYDICEKDTFRPENER
ncbi:MAG: phosphohydrolase [Clostridiales bacterium]|nr:phosphohydrolase [Clostridiales bacterium]